MPRQPIDRAVLAGLALWAILQACIIAFFDGTYDAGDSVMHYLHARHAPTHPENLLDHWAKPVFTLLATPFAQAGWPGIKAMQCLLALLSAWGAYRLAAPSRLAWLAPIALLLAPAYFLAQFSGLTEPMFGAVLVWGLLGLKSGRHVGAGLLLSLLPLVRTEGMLLLPLFGIWMLWRREWVSFLLLGTTLVVYSVIGGVVKGDWLWIIHENPYQGGQANYGSGTWGHFFEQYVYVAGIPIAVLTGLGLVATALLRRNMKPDAMLLRAAFLVYFLAHVVFWATGTGHSLGMTRVMVAIAPLGAVLASDGLLLLTLRIPVPLARAVLTVIVAAYTLVFPFTKNPAGLHLPKDLELMPDQVLAQRAATFLQSRGPIPKPLHLSHPSVAMFAGLDPFDSTQVRSLKPLLVGVPTGTVVVWDGWFSVKEDGAAESYWQVEQALYTRLWADSLGNAKMQVWLRK